MSYSVEAMTYDLVIEIVQGALCLATFGAIVAVVWKMMTGTIPLRGLLARRAEGEAEPERLIALAAALALPALYLVRCASDLMNGGIPRTLPAVDPWMLGALIASQSFYLAGKVLRS